MKLRYYLLLIFVALAMAPVALMRVWPQTAALEMQVSEVRERHLLLARNLVASLERYHRDLVATFELVTRTPEMWRPDADRSRLLENLAFRHICLADRRTGRLLDQIAPTTMPCPDTIPADIRAYFETVGADGRVAFGPVRGLPNGRNVIHMARFEGNRLMVGAINTDYFVTLGRGVTFGEMGHAAIVDQQGNVLAHPLDDWIAERRNIAKVSVVARMLAGETGVGTFWSPALKGDMIAGYSSVPGPGWGVMIPQPVEELEAKANEILHSTLIVLALGGAAALVLAIAVSVLIARPVERIGQFSRSIAAGALEVPSDGRGSALMPVEFQDLERNFRNMIDRLLLSMRRINELAFKDTVTDLGNRELFSCRMRRVVDRNGAGDRGALIFFDLDGFKAVNDIHGHDVGDDVLREVAVRVADIVDLSHQRGMLERYSDPLDAPMAEVPEPVAARLGGDEFAIFVAEADAGQVDALTARLLARLAEPYAVAGQIIRIGASIGVAPYPEAGSTYGSLLKAADMAMYRAKRNGKNQVCRFTDRIRRGVAARKALADELSLALECREFRPRFQPRYSTRTLNIVGVEALARWCHPSRGLLTPEVFLPIARETGQLSRIDHELLVASVGAMLDLERRGCKLPDLSTNVSADWLRDPAMLDHVKALPEVPFGLSFELMESVLFDRLDDTSSWVLEQLDARGIGIELDDFGSGHASITALVNLRPRTLKIDKALIGRVDTDKEHRALVRSIIEMGRSLGITVSAEGVENRAQLHLLRRYGCQQVQGNLLAPAMTAAELAQHLGRGGAAADVSG